MIGSQKKLIEKLSGGETVALLSCGTGFRWQISGTGEHVALGAVRTAAERGKLAVLQRDLCGDPMQYGSAEQA